MEPQLVITEDGSHTLYLQEWNEHYHSQHGAIAESNYVFIEQGLDALSAEKIDVRIFEMGFGTGLNPLLAWNWASRRNKKLRYQGVEKYPLKPEIFQQLNYALLPSHPDLQEYAELLHQMHRAESGNVYFWNEGFEFLKNLEDVETVSVLPGTDLVFYDAFAPSKQPQVWDLAILDKIYQSMNPGAILVSYCAQGQFKRNLKSLGFRVETLPGPPGKREMTRAWKEG